MRSGLFFTFEGIDGSGKTTQIEALRKFLERRRREVTVVREPGSTAVGEKIRELVLIANDSVVPKAEAALFAAARAQLVETVIRPALRDGVDVICDRYIDSSLAYQGFGRELGIDRILAFNEWMTNGLMPHHTFLLRLPAEDINSRLNTQLALFRLEEGAAPDRLEEESLLFHRWVEEAYDELAARFTDRIVTIDARLPRTKVSKLVRSHVEPLLEGESALQRAEQCLSLSKA